MYGVEEEVNSVKRIICTVDLMAVCIRNRSARYLIGLA